MKPSPRKPKVSQLFQLSLKAPPKETLSQAEADIEQRIRELEQKIVGAKTAEHRRKVESVDLIPPPESRLHANRVREATKRRKLTKLQQVELNRKRVRCVALSCLLVVVLIGLLNLLAHVWQ